jgi:hypothetical protein
MFPFFEQSIPSDIQGKYIQVMLISEKHIIIGICERISFGGRD